MSHHDTWVSCLPNFKDQEVAIDCTVGGQPHVLMGKVLITPSNKAVLETAANSAFPVDLSAEGLRQNAVEIKGVRSSASPVDPYLTPAQPGSGGYGTGIPPPPYTAAGDRPGSGSATGRDPTLDEWDRVDSPVQSASNAASVSTALVPIAQTTAKTAVKWCNKAWKLFSSAAAALVAAAPEICEMARLSGPVLTHLAPLFPTNPHVFWSLPVLHQLWRLGSGLLAGRALPVLAVTAVFGYASQQITHWLSGWSFANDLSPDARRHLLQYYQRQADEAQAEADRQRREAEELDKRQTRAIAEIEALKSKRETAATRGEQAARENQQRQADLQKFRQQVRQLQ